MPEYPQKGLRGTRKEIRFRKLDANEEPIPYELYMKDVDGSTRLNMVLEDPENPGSFTDYQIVPPTSAGSQGPQGPIGPQGTQGIQGESIVGPQGETGATGSQGLPGETGPQGVQGPQGPAAVGGGLTYHAELNNTTSPNNTITVNGISILTGTNADFAIVPRGTGSILASVPDGTSTGGNKRGSNSVDLQILRTSNTQVASGSYSSLLGGVRNTVSGTQGVIGGGSQNTISSLNGTVAGGSSNTINSAASYCTISGGTSNTIANGAYNSTIGGGQFNGASAHNSFIGGGYFNNISSTLGGYNIIVGGNNNSISYSSGSGYSIIGGGRNNQTISSYTTIAGGSSHYIDSSADYSVISGGNDHSINTNSAYSTIAGGNTNIISVNSNYASILGGRDNTVSAPYGTILSGRNHLINTAGDFGVILGGNDGVVRNPSQVVLSTGNIFNNGDTQISFYHMKVHTYPAAQTRPMQINSSTSGVSFVRIPSYQTVLLDIQILGVDEADGANCAAYQIQGMIRRALGANTTQAVFNNKTVLHESTNAIGWDVTLQAEDTNGGFRILCSSDSTYTVKWTANVRATEVGYWTV